MSKKTNSSSYHFENYIQIQKLNFVLKIRFSISELAPRAEKIKTIHSIKKNGILEFTVRPRYSLCSHTEKVKESMLKKYFKILLVSKSVFKATRQSLTLS